MSLNRRVNRKKIQYGKECSDLVVMYVAEAINAKDKQEKTEIFNKYNQQWFEIVRKANANEKGVLVVDRTMFGRMAEKNYKSIERLFRPKKTIIQKIKSAFSA